MILLNQIRINEPNRSKLSEFQKDSDKLTEHSHGSLKYQEELIIAFYRYFHIRK